jgi:hypothetical protein
MLVGCEKNRLPILHNPMVKRLYRIKEIAQPDVGKFFTEDEFESLAKPIAVQFCQGRIDVHDLGRHDQDGHVAVVGRKEVTPSEDATIQGIRSAFRITGAVRQTAVNEVPFLPQKLVVSPLPIFFDVVYEIHEAVIAAFQQAPHLIFGECKKFSLAHSSTP